MEDEGEACVSVCPSQSDEQGTLDTELRKCHCSQQECLAFAPLALSPRVLLASLAPVAMSKCRSGDAQGKDRCLCLLCGAPGPALLLGARLGQLVSELEELCWLLMSLGAVVQTEGVAHA